MGLVRTGFLTPAQKLFCLSRSGFRKKVNQDFRFVSLMNGTDGKTADLKNRDAGNAVLGKLDLSVFRPDKLSVDQKADPGFCAHSGPAGKIFSFAFQRHKGGKRRNNFMSKFRGDPVAASIGAGNGGRL